MMVKFARRSAVVIVLLGAVSGMHGQPGNKNAPVPGSAAAKGPAALSAPAGQDGISETPEHIKIATPAPAPPVWPLHERISWVVSVLTPVLGYIAIMLGLSLLGKIERQTRAAEAAATAAAESAETALEQARAITRAERPWILVTAEAAQEQTDHFRLMATNRGRSPAKIVAIADEMVFASGEKTLPAIPVYRGGDSQPPLEPLFLLPGEAIELKKFSREEVNELCGGEDQLKKIENWEDRIYFYGRILYKDLSDTRDAGTHETSWCCWYIHGRKKSGMVMADVAGYCRKT